MEYFLPTKKLLNSLSCPICKAQIDIISGRCSSLYKGYDYGCVINFDHYVLYISGVGNYSPKIEKEAVAIYNDKHKYQLVKTYLDNQVKTEITVFNIDPEGRVQFSFRNNSAKFDFDIFDFANFNMETALTKIETVLLLY